MTALRLLRNTKSNNNNLPCACGCARVRLRITNYNNRFISVLRGLKPRNTTPTSSAQSSRARLGRYGNHTTRPDYQNPIPKQLDVA